MDKVELKYVSYCILGYKCMLSIYLQFVRRVS